MAGDARTVAPAEALPRPAAAVAARGDGAWVVVHASEGWRAHRLDGAGESVGAPWDLGLGEMDRPAVAGDDRTLYLAVAGDGEVWIGRWAESGAPAQERLVGCPVGHRLLGIVLRGREVWIATAGDDGRGASVRTMPRDLSEDGRVVSTDAGAPGARWAPPVAFGPGIALVASSGPMPIATLFRPAHGARVVELALARGDVGPAWLAPWAGAGFAAWTVREEPDPVVAIRTLGDTLTPTGRPRCARGFPGATAIGLLASAAGPVLGWAARSPSGPWRIAVAAPGAPLAWIVGERVEDLAPAGRIDAADLHFDGTVRLPGRRAITLPELAGPQRSMAASASRRGETVVVYSTIQDGRRRIRLVRVDRRGRVTLPLTISTTARVELDVAAEWPASGPVVRWREEHGRDVVVHEEAVGP